MNGRYRGFDIKLEQLETNTGYAADLAGDFDAALLTWSGRADPDANLSIWMTCQGPLLDFPDRRSFMLSPMAITSLKATFGLPMPPKSSCYHLCFHDVSRLIVSIDTAGGTELLSARRQTALRVGPVYIG